MHLFEFKSKRRPIVYVDMDGVLADFFGEIARAHGVDHWREIRRKDIGIDQIAKEEGFFTDLPPLPNSGRVIATALQVAGQYSILSSPLQSEVEQSSEEKTEWLRKHLKRHQPQAIIYDHDKWKYAVQADGTPNILIDDYETNIRLWNAHGGIGIHYKDRNWDKLPARLEKAWDRAQQVKHKNPTDGDHTDVTEGFEEHQLYTSKDVLEYVKGIHHEYHLEKPILKHKVWKLDLVPVESLKTPEYYHQDDPYRRVIDLDWDHIDTVTGHDIKNKPVVVDGDGWVLDGNHRVTAARVKGLTVIPALVPATK